MRVEPALLIGPPTMVQEIYRDDDLLVVNKPAGLLCVPGLSSPDNLFDRVKASAPNARVVHRLDMATSGLVMFALHYEAQKALSQVFEKRRIRKRYRAVVSGLLTANSSGEIALPLICDWPNRPRQKVCWLQGKPALTRYQTLGLDKQQQRTELALFPVTGRTHQLRVHMHAIGHGIVGDELYPTAEVAKSSERLLLHAESLHFIQPLSRRPLEIHAPAPF